MSAVFKRLERRDAFISPYTAHKTFTFTSSSFGEVGIEWKRGVSGSFPYNEEALTYAGTKHIMFDTHGQVSTEFDWTSSLGTELNILSIPRNLYGLSIKPGSFSLEMSGSTTLTDSNGYILSGSTKVGYISYSKGLVAFTDGDYELAGAFTSSLQLSSSQAATLQYETNLSPSGSYTSVNNWLTTVSSSTFDPGELWVLSNIADGYPVNPIGGDGKPTDAYIHKTDANSLDISSAVSSWTDMTYKVKDFYTASLFDQDVVITNVTAFGDGYHLELDSTSTSVPVAPAGSNNAQDVDVTPSFTQLVYSSAPVSYTASIQATEPILTHTYHCHIDPNEFGLSYNPSLQDNTKVSGSLVGFATGSDFRTYATAVGLYNSAGELIAVGKLSEPTPILNDTHYTFVVKIDL